MELLVKTVETNPRYKNLLFMTMHYIDSPNFFTFNKKYLNENSHQIHITIHNTVI